MKQPLEKGGSATRSRIVLTMPQFMLTRLMRTI